MFSYSSLHIYRDPACTCQRKSVLSSTAMTQHMMGKREMNKARKRAEIVAIATRSLFYHGYASTSTSAIAEKLGGPGSGGRRVGQKWVSMGRSRWSRDHEK